MLKAIVFDFDGVIVDSNHIKRNVYYEIFSSFRNSKEIVGEVLNQFEPNTRNFIIGKIIEKLVKTGSIESKDVVRCKNKFVKEYGRICEKEVLECREIEGALRSVIKLSEKYHLYVNSLTPLEPLKRIIKKRGLYNYFKGIFGGEKSKAENLKTIISIEQISPLQLLVVGDGTSDLKVARQFGSSFLGIDNRDGELRNRKLKYLLKDCSQLCRTVEKIIAETK